MLPADHDARLQRALVSLAGLSVGDAFGERFFGPPGFAQSLIAQRKPPPPKWGWTTGGTVHEAFESSGQLDF